jgi:hypothetical protein
MPDVTSYAWAHKTMTSIVGNIETVLFGKTTEVKLVVAALAAGGHVLLEDVPGTGKTSLASALASSVRCYYRRIQFTPDVMPSDISGFYIYNQKTNDFEFRPGAVMGWTRTAGRRSPTCMRRRVTRNSTRPNQRSRHAGRSTMPYPNTRAVRSAGSAISLAPSGICDNRPG